MTMFNLTHAGITAQSEKSEHWVPMTELNLTPLLWTCFKSKREKRRFLFLKYYKFIKYDPRSPDSTAKLLESSKGCGLQLLSHSQEKFTLHSTLQSERNFMPKLFQDEIQIYCFWDVSGILLCFLKLVLTTNLNLTYSFLAKFRDLTLKENWLASLI